ncbi:hypothetical protein EJB05_48589, partial [Eragrostis curvula]
MGGTLGLSSGLVVGGGVEALRGEEGAARSELGRAAGEWNGEVSRLMDLIVRSLYSHKEVFLRELVSDTGVRMTKDELKDCLGTIAQSGTSKFLKALKENKDLGPDNGLIGQFGVGFYSAFLVAEKIVVSTKSPKSDKQYVWEAEADSSSYVIKRLILRTCLHPDDKFEFADPSRIQGLVKNYSQFVSFPIYTWQEKSRTVERMKSQKKVKRLPSIVLVLSVTLSSSSTCVLVSGKFGWSANMERCTFLEIDWLMKAQTLGDTSSLEFMRGRRIFEINPDHPIVKDLNAACKNEPESTEAKRAVELLYETALISSGYTSPAELGGKIYEMMAIALGGRWGRSDTEEAEASAGEAGAEGDSSEGTVTEEIEPSEIGA